MAKRNPPIIAESSTQMRSSIEKVWQVLAIDFDKIENWSSGVKRSVPQGKPLDGAKVGGRHCYLSAVGFTEMDEEILIFDTQNHVLSYRLYNGLPGFVTRAVNTWRLSESQGGMYLTGRTEMHTTGIMGCVMRPMMQMSLNSAVKSMAEELTHYVDMGKPHPKKQKALDKLT